MKLVWIFAVLPFCLGQVTNDNCMTLVDDFVSIINGSDLNVCGSYVQGLQCCSQMNENALGMTLNNALNTPNVDDLGIEVRAMQSAASALYYGLTDLGISLVQDVLRPLMISGVDYDVLTENSVLTRGFNATLDMLRDEILSNINATIQGSMNVNLTAEIARYFGEEGLALFYFSARFEANVGSSLTSSGRMCGVRAVNNFLFPATEQVEIGSLGNNLQRIKVTYDVARAVLNSTNIVLTALENFNASYTCTNVWTQQYGCPRCAGQTPPLCQGRCNEVLIGCMSSLQQMIVQLNVLLDFTRASVNSLLSGNPFDDINLNNIAQDYINIFNTSRSLTLDLLEVVEPQGCNLQPGKKKSVDDSIVRHKRYSNIDFPTVTINQSIVTRINDTLLPAVMNVYLSSDRLTICDFLMANGSDNCTIGVGNIGTYMSNFTYLDIADQINNPAGTFNLTQLREQAQSLPYVMNNLLMDRNDIMMLYNYVLPGRPVPNLDFLNVTTTTTTTTTTATPTPTVTPVTSPPGGGGAAAISYSLFITLVAVLLASIL